MHVIRGMILPALAMLLLSLNEPVVAFEVLQPLPAHPIVPKENPITPLKVELGKQLFFDPRLSLNKTLSCNNCHNLAGGGDDDGATTRTSRSTSSRSAPSVWNVGYLSVQYWDGRAKNLEAAIEEHLVDPSVMGMKVPNRLEQRLRKVAGYNKAFKDAFEEQNAVTTKNMARALATFFRTLNTPNSAFDRYIAGDKNALSPSAQKGLTLFNETGCLACHFGVAFAGPAPGPAYKMGDGFYELFPNYLGSEYDKKYKLTNDEGRVLVTKDVGHRYMWRVPSLRNIALTAPYFHNGSVKNLDEAVRIMAKTQFNKKLSREEVTDIVAFLRSLTGEFPEMTLPRLPDSAGASLE